jgi:hypothetical protein
MRRVAASLSHCLHIRFGLERLHVVEVAACYVDGLLWLVGTRCMWGSLQTGLTTPVDAAAQGENGHAGLLLICHCFFSNPETISRHKYMRVITNCWKTLGEG